MHHLPSLSALRAPRLAVLHLSLALMSAGCAADPPLPEPGAVDESGLGATAAVGVVAFGGGSGTAVGATAAAAVTACISSVVCGVVVGVVVVGGATIIAIQFDNQEDAEWAALYEHSLEIEDGDTVQTVRTSQRFQPLFDTRWSTIIEGTIVGRAPSPFERFVAVTYSWQCDRHLGGSACLERARDYISCATHGGGNACYGAATVGSIEQYRGLYLASTREDSDDQECHGSASPDAPESATAAEVDAARQVNRTGRLGGRLMISDCTPAQSNRMRTHLDNPNPPGVTPSATDVASDVRARLRQTIEDCEGLVTLDLRPLDEDLDALSEWQRDFLFNRDLWVSTLLEGVESTLLVFLGPKFYREVTRSPDLHSHVTSVNCDSF